MSKVHVYAAPDPLLPKKMPVSVTTLCEKEVKRPEIAWIVEGDLRELGSFNRLGNCSKCAAKEVKGRYVYGIREGQISNPQE